MKSGFWRERGLKVEMGWVNRYLGEKISEGRSYGKEKLKKGALEKKQNSSLVP